jgi:hypothetical protein
LGQEQIKAIDTIKTYKPINRFATVSIDGVVFQKFVEIIICMNQVFQHLFLNLTKLINILNNTFLSFITEKKGRPFKKF